MEKLNTKLTENPLKIHSKGPSEELFLSFETETWFKDKTF